MITALQGMFVFYLVCSGAENCPNKPIYDDNTYYSIDDCKDSAQKIARAMHYKQGGDWAWKCISADYQPKELP
jgi:hypothetical protein